MPLPLLQRQTSATTRDESRGLTGDREVWFIGPSTSSLTHANRHTHKEQGKGLGEWGGEGDSSSAFRREITCTLLARIFCFPNRWQPLGSTGRRSVPDVKEPLMKVSKRSDESIRRTRPDIQCFLGRRKKKRDDAALCSVLFQCERQTKSGKVSHEICSR